MTLMMPVISSGDGSYEKSITKCHFHNRRDKHCFSSRHHCKYGDEENSFLWLLLSIARFFWFDDFIAFAFFIIFSSLNQQRNNQIRRRQYYCRNSHKSLLFWEMVMIFFELLEMHNAHCFGSGRLKN